MKERGIGSGIRRVRKSADRTPGTDSGEKHRRWGFFAHTGFVEGTYPRCAHLEEHTCLTAPAMFMQVMVAIL